MKKAFLPILLISGAILAILSTMAIITDKLGETITFNDLLYSNYIEVDSSRLYISLDDCNTNVRIFIFPAVAGDDPAEGKIQIHPRGMQMCEVISRNRLDQLIIRGTRYHDYVEYKHAPANSFKCFLGRGNDFFEAELASRTEIEVHGEEGDDKIYGGPVNDHLDGGPGRDIINGRDGNDRLDGGPDNDVISSGAGNDIIRGMEGNDTLSGKTGEDIIYGHMGYDTIDGGDGNDVLFGGEENDWIYGKLGNDRLYGEADNDWLFGEAGNDELYGGPGNDHLRGGVGTDMLYGESGTDELIGGPDYDTIVSDEADFVIE